VVKCDGLPVNLASFKSFQNFMRSERAMSTAHPYAYLLHQ
jgi:hypothetical protein